MKGPMEEDWAKEEALALVPGVEPLSLCHVSRSLHYSKNATQKNCYHYNIHRNLTADDVKASEE